MSKRKTLIATYNSEVLKLADVVVVDVQCDYEKRELGNMRNGEADMAALEATMRTIGETIMPHCLVLIETTVAPPAQQNLWHGLFLKRHLLKEV